MKVLKWIFIVLCSLAVMALLALKINDRLNNTVKLTNYTFEHNEVPESFDGYKIMVISDLHNAPFSDVIRKHIMHTVPDAIVITGDMAQLPEDNIDETIKIVEGIGVPVYAVSGNHDTQGGSYAKIKEKLVSTGVRMLDDDSVSISQNGESVLLIGIKDPVEDVVSEEKIKAKKAHIKKSMPDGPAFSILLNHRANLYTDLKDSGVDLILSGHLHGGVVRIPFLGGVVGHTKGEYFPDYTYGMYKEGEGAAMIVSGGCDKNLEKKRYFNPPEVVLITLKKI